MEETGKNTAINETPIQWVFDATIALHEVSFNLVATPKQAKYLARLPLLLRALGSGYCVETSVV